MDHICQLDDEQIVNKEGYQKIFGELQFIKISLQKDIGGSKIYVLQKVPQSFFCYFNKLLELYLDTIIGMMRREKST
jgi:hypothetical protein